jgi:hypothetical protein
MAHNEVAGIKCEQSRLVFNGPVGCSSNWQGFLTFRFTTSNNPRIMLAASKHVKHNLLKCLPETRPVGG